MENIDANVVTLRIASQTPCYIEQVLFDAAESVQKIYNWYIADGKKVFEKYLSIDT